MTTNPSRRPPGTPAGGQYAPTAHPRPSFELEADEPDRDALALRLATQVLADHYGPEVAQRFADAEATHCRSCDGAGCQACRGTGRKPTARDWAAAGVTDPEALGRLDAGGYRPEDLDSPDRDLRLAAHDAAGTMVLDGELLSGALQLRRHEPGLDPRRHFHHEQSVYLGGEVVDWSALSADDQCDYIAGYAAAAAGKPRTEGPEASPAAAGYQRGGTAARVAAWIDAGRSGDHSVVVVDPDASGRRLVVTDVRPAPERGGYEARVASGQRRRHHGDDGSRDVPWAEGSRVFFTADALGV